MKTMQSREVGISHLASRFNAHLTFNVLNTVQGMVLINEKDEAIELIGTYSRVLRKMLINDSLETSLGNEMDIISDYISIEKYRMESNFTYEMKLPKSQLQKKIPKSLIISLAENAIKHGIRYLGNSAYLTIDSPSTDFDTIRVRNNAPITDGSTKGRNGIGLIRDLIKKYNELTGSSLSLVINSNLSQNHQEMEFEALVSLK